MMKVSVIIPNLNGRHLLGGCLESLRLQTFTDCEIIIVDNGSSDGSVDYVRSSYSEVEVIQNASNDGFAKGCNLGIAAARGEFIATLNNDTRADSRWLEELVCAVKAGEKLGMAASKMLFFDQPNMINSAGICIDRAGIAWDRFGGRDDGSADTDRAIEIFGPCAGAALYRRAMLDDVGLFDEQFFMYLEDVDLAWRAQARGWGCIYVPTARVYHMHSASAGEGSAFKRYLLARNKVWLIAKNYPSPHIFLYLPAIILFDLLAISRGVVTSRDLMSARGRLVGIRSLKQVLHKRRQLKGFRKSGASQLMAQLAAIESPWTIMERYRHLVGSKK